MPKRNQFDIEEEKVTLDMMNNAFTWKGPVLYVKMRRPGQWPLTGIVAEAANAHGLTIGVFDEKNPFVIKEKLKFATPHAAFAAGWVVD